MTRARLTKIVSQVLFEDAVLDVASRLGGWSPGEAFNTILRRVEPAATKDELNLFRIVRAINLVPPDDGSCPSYDAEQVVLRTAQTFVLKQKYWAAKRLCIGLALHLVGDKPWISCRQDVEAFRTVCTGLKDVTSRALLSECLIELGRCELIQPRPDTLKGLALFEEADTLEHNSWVTSVSGLNHDWDRIRTSPLPHALNTSQILYSSALAFEGLGNTGAYHYRTVMAKRYLVSLSGGGEQVGLALDLEECLDREAERVPHLRHPDPSFNPQFQLEDPRLQVCGAWKKLTIPADRIMGKRVDAATFIWKGYLYVVGGSAEPAREDREPSDPRDVWRVRLEPPSGWEFVSRCPLSKRDFPHSFTNRTIQVYNDKAYVFLGRPWLEILDLKTGRWETARTRYKSTVEDRLAGIDSDWPWPGKIIIGSAQHIIGNRLLVFGGVISKLVGSNLLMELNLSTMRWRRLSGTRCPQQHSDPSCPGPRFDPASWVDEAKRKLFILFGKCDRRRPAFGTGGNFGPTESWLYDDFWSWDLDAEKWTREVISGNPPAPRSATGYVYNKAINRVIVFGGESQDCPFNIPNTEAYVASIFADTFVYTPKSDSTDSTPHGRANSTSTSKQNQGHRWQQVMTCGFPTYRVGASLVCDPDTGKTYLYGGRVRGEFAPSRRCTEADAAQRAKYPFPGIPTLLEKLGDSGKDLFSRSLDRHLGDVWQLHIDVPGGHFELIDKEEEIRTAEAGPWQRCFECGKTDFWKKCGGSCGGRVYFCSHDCQVKGWITHKRMHSCKKA